MEHEKYRSVMMKNNKRLLEDRGVLSLYSEIFKEDKTYNTVKEISKDPVYAGCSQFVISNNFKRVIDVGTGRGNFINLLLTYNKNLEITSLDLAKFNDLDIPFIPVDLTGDLTSIESLRADVLTCTGVLEHIPIGCLDKVFRVFSTIAPFATFTIANHSDSYRGIDIHITNMVLTDWLPIIQKHYQVINTQKYYEGDRLFLINVKSLNYEDNQI